MARINKDQLDSSLLNTASSAASFPTLNQNTTGTASNITGTLAVTQGGTGTTTTTGSGANVLGTSPTIATATLTSPAISGSGNISTSGTANFTGQVTLGAAGAILASSTRTAATTLTTTSSTINICNSATAFTVTLPATTTANIVFIIKNIGTAAVTVSATSIDGAASVILAQYEEVTVYSTATSGTWYTLRAYSPLNVKTTAAQTLTNKTLTAPVISTISNTGTVTLPTATDTLVGRATTDTLSNKTLDATNQVSGNSGVPTAPASGFGKFFGIGTSTVRPGFINSSGTSETIVTTTAISTDANGWTCMTIGNFVIASKVFSANVPALSSNQAATILLNSGNSPSTWTQAKQVAVQRNFFYEVGSSYQLPLTNENQGGGDNPTTPLVIVNRSGASVGATTNGISVHQTVTYTT